MGTRATAFGVGAMLMVAGAGRLAAQQPATSAVPRPTSALEPPKFEPAPVSAAVKSAVEDPFEQDGVTPGTPKPVGGGRAPMPAAGKTVGAPVGSTGMATPPTITTPPTAAQAQATPPTITSPAQTTPAPTPGAPSTTMPGTTAPPGTPTPTPTPVPDVPVPPVAPPTTTRPASAPDTGFAPPSPAPAPAPSTNRPDGATSVLEPIDTRGISQYEDLQPGPEPAVSSRAPDLRRGNNPGIAIQAGGGIMNFGSSVMQELTQAGGYWDARLVLGMYRFFAFEVAYVGTANPVTAPGVAEGSTLIGNGGEGALRLNIPVITREGAYITPFGIVGLGWQHYRVGSTNGTVLASGDDVVTVPLGGGFAIGYGHLFLDTRFTYRFTQQEDLLPANGRSHDQLRQWTFGGNFGYVF